MSLLQQFLMIAGLFAADSIVVTGDPCSHVAHVPRADVAYQRPRTESGIVPADLNPPLEIDLSQIQVPIVVDVLRGRPAGNGPVGAQGETFLGSVHVNDRGQLVAKGPIAGAEAGRTGEGRVLAHGCVPLHPPTPATGARPRQ